MNLSNLSLLMIPISDIIAFFALILTAFSLYKSVQSNHKSNLIQQRVLGIEEAREIERINQSLKAEKADLVAEIVEDRAYLKITNLGLAEAREVKVLINGKPVLDHLKVNEHFPQSTSVPPSLHIKYYLRKNQSIDTQEVYISWKDNDGNNFSKNTLHF